MKLTRMLTRRNAPPIIEVDRDFLFASMMLAHIERLPTVSVVAKRSWAIADSFEAFIEYQGWRFYMGIPFGCIMIAAQDPRTPQNLLDELAAHIDNYRTVWLGRFLWALTRYFFLPLKPEKQPA
jgi:hypothetical protein